MPLEADVYNYLSCSGKVDNLVSPKCLARSEGVFNDADTMRKRALVAGWTSPNKTADFCPTHSAASGIVIPPATKARAAKVPTAAAGVSDQLPSDTPRA